MSDSSSITANAEAVVSHFAIVRGGAWFCDPVGIKVAGSHKCLSSAGSQWGIADCDSATEECPCPVLNVLQAISLSGRHFMVPLDQDSDFANSSSEMYTPPIGGIP